MVKKLFIFFLTLLVSVTSWAADPYFEVISGSFASGNVTVKATFPGATSLEVGTTSLLHPDWDLSAHGWSPVAYDFHPTKEGNTMTVTFTGFSPLSGDLKYSIQSYDLKVDGVSYSAEIQSKDAIPYAEVAEGDLSAGGNVVIDVTFPTFTSASTYPASWKSATLKYNETAVATCAMDKITNTNKTLHVSFNLGISPGSDLSLYSVNFPSGYVQNDGVDVYNEYNVFFSTPTPSGCEHTNCTSHPAVEPTESTPGNIAYVQCNDCEKYFAASDTEHTTPLEWSAIELTYCAHEHLGADDICADCNRVLPHAPRTITWTVNGITATYNKAARSLTFSGEGTMPSVDLYSFAEDQKIAKLIEAYPWYEALNPRLEGWSIVADAVSTLTIENGVHIGSESDATQYIVAGVFYDHTTYEWHLNADVIVVDNDDAKAPYSYHSHVHTPADLASMGVTSFPSEVFLSMGNHYHLAQYTKQPECPHYSSYNLYCPVCGYYFNGGSAWSSEAVKHDYNYAGICNNCGAKNPALCTHNNVNSFAAVASTSANHGHIAFKKCSDCGQYYAADDASCSTALDFETQVLLPLATPACSHVMHEMIAKCTYRYSKYYACEVCELLFADAEGVTEISEADVMHNYDGDVHNCAHCGKPNPAYCDHSDRKYFNRVESTCTEDGLWDHSICNSCDALLDGWYQVTTLEALKIPKTGHSFNEYGVCVDCSSEEEGAQICYHSSTVTTVGDSRTSCIQGVGPGIEVYYRCDLCKRYLTYDGGRYNTISKSDMQITPASQLHHGHLVRYNDKAPTCTEFGHSAYKECSDCHRKYGGYTSDDKCGFDNFISNADFDENYIGDEPLGHDIDMETHKCSRCDFAPTYRQVIANSQIKRGAYYIIVSKIGTQYYALSMPNDTEYRSFSKGYSAVPIDDNDVNDDGTITVTNPEVSQLFTLGDPGVTFYNPKFGLIGLEPGHPLSQLNSLITLGEEQKVPITYGDWDCNVMKICVANDRSTVWDYDGEKIDMKYGHMSDIVPGSLVWAMAGANAYGAGFAYHRTKIFHDVFLGAKGSEKTFVFSGTEPYRNEVDLNGFAEYYPTFLYILDTETYMNTGGIAGSISGPVDSDVIDEFISKSDKPYGSIDFRPSHGSIAADDLIRLLESGSVSESTVILLPDDYDLDKVKELGVTSKGNIVVDGRCEDFTITDIIGDVDIPATFTAAHLSYQRAMSATSQWGTLCMPFAVNSNDDIQLYKLSEVSEDEDESGVLTFTAVDEAAYGEPVVFRKKTKDADGISITMENAEIKSGDAEGINTDVSAWSIKGTLKNTIIQSGTKTRYDGALGRDVTEDVNCYYIAGDKFWNAKAAATVPAFRAWFESSEKLTGPTTSEAKSIYTILIVDEDENVTNVLTPKGDGELEECTEIYDLSGKKLTAPVKGQINIINGKKIYVK